MFGKHITYFKHPVYRPLHPIGLYGYKVRLFAEIGLKNHGLRVTDPLWGLTAGGKQKVKITPYLPRVRFEMKRIFLFLFGFTDYYLVV